MESYFPGVTARASRFTKSSQNRMDGYVVLVLFSKLMINFMHPWLRSKNYFWNYLDGPRRHSLNPGSVYELRPVSPLPSPWWCTSSLKEARRERTDSVRPTSRYRSSLEILSTESLIPSKTLTLIPTPKSWTSKEVGSWINGARCLTPSSGSTVLTVIVGIAWFSLNSSMIFWYFSRF